MGEELPFQAAPERSSTRYGPRAHANKEKCSQLATEFFKNGVARARERHLRFVCPALRRSTASPGLDSRCCSSDPFLARETPINHPPHSPQWQVCT